MASFSKPRCFMCLQPAKLKCSKCEGPPFMNGDTARWYCNRACQKTDWDQHKQTCLRRRKEIATEEKEKRDRENMLLYAERYGEILQELFYNIVEEMWAIDVVDVELGDEDIEDGHIKKMVLVAGKGDPVGKGFQKRRGAGLLFQFPPILQRPDRPVDREAMRKIILADRNSPLALAIMAPLVKHLFADIVDEPTDVRETYHKPKDGMTHIITQLDYFRQPVKKKFQLYGSVPDHAAFEIVLKSGQKIALDLAGAEFGSPHRTVMPWNEYEEKYGTDVVRRSHFGKCTDGLRKQVHKQGTRPSLVTLYACAVNQTMALVVCETFKKDRPSVQSYAKQQEERFIELTGELHRCVRGVLSAVVDEVDRCAATIPKLLQGMDSWMSEQILGED